MDSDSVITRLTQSAEIAAGTSFSSSTGLVGLFQALRPEGLKEEGLFDGIHGGQEFEKRLTALYAAVRTSSRADGMRDAYFIVREPLSAEPATIGDLGATFAHGVIAAYAAQSDTEHSVEADSPQAFDLPVKRPAIRVLEGKAPRHPKEKAERSRLLEFLTGLAPSQVNAKFSAGSLGEKLGEALYFVACDPWLRDYLRWPLFSESMSRSGNGESIAALGDALDAYFELWRHGVKFRIFSDKQVDFYIPRHFA